MSPVPSRFGDARGLYRLREVGQGGPGEISFEGFLSGRKNIFEGRMDNQIKLHGYRIELGDVEANLRTLPGVCDAIALPVLRAGVPDALAAFVIFHGSINVL